MAKGAKTKSRAVLSGRKQVSQPRGSTSGVDQTNWRTKLRASKIKFDDSAKERFLDHYARTGRFGQSSVAAGVHHDTVYNHIDNDEEFALAYTAAKEAYRDRVHQVVELVALEGLEEPIIGGKDRDEVVATKRVIATNILAMEMRKTDAGYRDKSEVELTHRGGVLVVPAQLSMEEWNEKYAKKQPDSSQVTKPGNGLPFVERVERK